MKKLVIILGLIAWPLAFVVNNQPLRLDFPPKTIFVQDYQAEQKILRDTKLYKTPFMARLFHNKVRIPLDKFNNNLFALIDPNNYFFGFAPRQIAENQNLIKFPFAALPFVLLGIWKLGSYKHKKLVILSFSFGVLALSLLENFDKYDLILWLPISLVFIHGVNSAQSKPKSKIFYLFFIILASIELIRILVQ